MNDTLTRMTAQHQAEQPGTPLAPTTLQSSIASWRWRTRFRRELEQKSSDDPRLIDDIGLTKRQVETEIAKPFWRR